jgi:transcriptional regulator with XRE-family HTH domain
MAGRPGPVGPHPLSQLVRSRRQELDLTLKQLADRSGLSESMLSRIERGRRVRLTQESAAGLANALHVAPSALLTLGGVFAADELASLAGVSDFQQHLMADPNLTAAGRQTLLAAYRLLVPTAAGMFTDDDGTAA